MKKVIQGNTIHFYDNEIEIMYIDHSKDECIWCFNTDRPIIISPDMEMYGILDNFMKQDYLFSNEILQNYKDKGKLIWYSDCYYDPDDKWSIDSVGCLHIEKENDSFKIWCTREIDKEINRTDYFYCISFSPSSNGRYSQNINTGFTLQDDFVMLVYQKLLNTKKKTLKYRK